MQCARIQALKLDFLLFFHIPHSFTTSITIIHNPQRPTSSASYFIILFWGAKAELIKGGGGEAAEGICVSARECVRARIDGSICKLPNKC